MTTLRTANTRRRRRERLEANLFVKEWHEALDQLEATARHIHARISGALGSVESAIMGGVDFGARPAETVVTVRDPHTGEILDIFTGEDVERLVREMQRSLEQDVAVPSSRTPAC